MGYLHRASPTPDRLGIVTLSTRDGGLRYYERTSGKLARRIDLPNYVEFEDADFVIIGERPLRVLVQRESGVVSYELEGSGPPRAVALPAAFERSTFRAPRWRTIEEVGEFLLKHAA